MKYLIVAGFVAAWFIVTLPLSGCTTTPAMPTYRVVGAGTSPGTEAGYLVDVDETLPLVARKD